MCLGLFVGVAAVWAWYIYVAFGATLFRGRGRPTFRAMASQVGVSSHGCARMSAATAAAHCMQTAIVALCTGVMLLCFAQVWCTAIPLYAVMPAAIEWAAEQGLTRAYSRFAQPHLVVSRLRASCRAEVQAAASDRGSGCSVRTLE